MSVTIDTPAVGFQQINTTVTGPDLLVALSGDHGVVLAGVADDPIGVSYQCSGLSGFGTANEMVSVLMLREGVVRRFTAAGAITQGAKFYRAASGKVSATAIGAPLGVALGAASGNASVFEGLCYGLPKPSDFHKLVDPGNAGAIPVTQSGVLAIVTTAGAETRTLAIPSFHGQWLTLTYDTDSTSCAVTVASAFNEAGNTTITFTDAKESCNLIGTTAAGVLRWQMISNDGATLG